MSSNLRIPKFYPERLKELSDSLPDLEKLAKGYVLNNQAPKLSYIDRLSRYVAQNMKPAMTFYDIEFPEAPYFAKLASAAMQDTALKNMILNIYHTFKTKKLKRYVFCRDFFNELKDTKLDKIKPGDLVQGCGAVRFPFDVQDDIDGASFSEFVFSVMPVREFYNLQNEPDMWAKMKFNDKLTDDALMWNITWIDSNGAHNYSTQPFEGDAKSVQDFFIDSEFKLRGLNADTQKIYQEDGYSLHIKAIFNCLAYLKSGDPDLRKDKNVIEYKSPHSTKPLRKDKGLSTEEFELVGYTFKKNPLYTQEFYYQPAYYARRGDAKVWTWCKGSLKRRKDF